MTTKTVPMRLEVVPLRSLAREDERIPLETCRLEVSSVWRQDLGNSVCRQGLDVVSAADTDTPPQGDITGSEAEANRSRPMR